LTGPTYRRYPAPCPTGKRPYTDKADAKREAKRLETTPGVKVGRVGVYRCHECGTWHIGHSAWGHRLRDVS
jgi:hypothetical protein